MMPQGEERKRVYNRQRNRRLRGYGVLRSRRLSGEGEYEGGGVVPDHNVVPDREREHVVPWKNDARVWGMSDRQIIVYMTRLVQHGYGLMFTERHYEFVDLVTGVIGLGYRPEGETPNYQQEPTYKVIKEAAWTPLERTEATEQRIMALEAEMVLLRAAMNSGVEEEREEP